MTNDDREAILKAVESWTAAWESGEWRRATQHYAEDADWTNAFGVTCKSRVELEATLEHIFSLPHVMAGRAFNSHDLAVLDELVAEDYTNHDPPFPGLPAGREGLKQTFAGFWSAFPDVQGTIEHLIADEDKVAILVSFRGTHRGDLMGIPPTEREVAIRFMDIFRVAGAQIAERWAVAGRAGLMRQLGAVAEGTSSDGAMTAG